MRIFNRRHGRKTCFPPIMVRVGMPPLHSLTSDSISGVNDAIQSLYIPSTGGVRGGHPHQYATYLPYGRYDTIAYFYSLGSTAILLLFFIG